MGPSPLRRYRPVGPIRVYPLCGASVAGPATPRFLVFLWGNEFPHTPCDAQASLVGEVAKCRLWIRLLRFRVFYLNDKPDAVVDDAVNNC